MSRIAVGAVLAALAVGLNPATTSAADATDSRIDQARYFFASAAAEHDARKPLDVALSALERRKGTVASDPAALLATLREYDAVRSLGARHTLYLHLLCALDRNDAASCEGEDKLDAEITSRTSFIEGEILKAPQATIADFIARTPALSAYRYQIASIERRRAHRLDESQESLLAQVTPSITGWQFPLYERTVHDIPFGTVKTAAGELDVIKQRALIIVDPDRSAREQRFRKLWAGYRSERDTLAFALLQTAKAGNTLAWLRQFQNAPDAHYFDLELDPTHARGLIETVAAKGSLSQRFERIRIADAQRLHGIADPETWDIDLPPPQAPHYSASQARDVLHAALGTLGAHYRDGFDALLDPRNGRFDVMPGASQPRGRAGGGFSLGYPGTTAVLFVGAFNGTYKELSVIAHEGGHAAHRNLMNEHGVRPAYAAGPSYLFESFAEFNELLLADYLAEHARDPALKRYYLQQFLAIKGLDFLYGAQDAALEQAIYDGVREGSLHDADGLDALTLKSDQRFSLWPERYPELKTRWASLSLAYEDPLYYVNYLYASLLALDYYHHWKKSPRAFARNYVALLENGFDAEPAALLRRFLDIDLTDDTGLVDSAVDVVEKRLGELEAR